jgi:hypothetical protein
MVGEKRGQRQIITVRALALLALLGAAAPASDTALQLAGRYQKQFPNALVDGTKYTGRDLVEIVPVAPRAAYVHAEFEFFNGHSCSIAGIAEAENGALVYRPQADAREQACVLTVRKTGKNLRISDNDGGCKGYCGARGSLLGNDLPFASRRPIRAISKIKSSGEFRDAMAEWSKRLNR